MSDCIFCKIVNGDIATELLHEDEHCIAFKDIQPRAPVHLLLIPKLHIVNLFELQTEHQAVLTNMLYTLPKLAKKQNLDGFRTVVNNGRSGGQEVFHLHFHLLGGGPLNPL